MAVALAVACGTPQEHIGAQIINPATGKAVDGKTLRRAFRAELDSGTATANALVAQSLFKKATGSGPQAVTAAIFWLKTRAGWKEPVQPTAPEELARTIRSFVNDMERNSNGSTTEPMDAHALSPDATEVSD